MGVLAQGPDYSGSESALSALLSPRQLQQVAIGLGLSPQQARIAALIVEGKPDKQIAAELDLAVGTVRTYLSRIFDRTGTTGRIELAVRILACAKTLHGQRGVINHADSKSADGRNADLH